jgi:hypothetical protein
VFIAVGAANDVCRTVAISLHKGDSGAGVLQSWPAPEPATAYIEGPTFMTVNGVTHFGIERRRSPRVQADDAYELSLSASLPVQVLDISLSGVLLASKAELAVGDRAEFHAAVGSRSLQVAIEVQRVTIDNSPQRGGGLRYRAGAVFADMSAEQRVALEQILAGERS